MRTNTQPIDKHSLFPGHTYWVSLNIWRLKSVRRVSGFLCLVLVFSSVGFSADDPRNAIPAPPALIWKNPDDIRSRNLLYGSGGEKGQPHLPATFDKEDMKGTSPKFDVRDQDSERWKVKLGVEAGPETVVSRLLWAVGYFTEEYYFVPDLKVAGLPKDLRRGKQFIEDGDAKKVRLKRHPRHAEKLGEWHWRDNPFNGTREFNGLRVIMALVNNWDLKDDNNSLYEDKETGTKLYLVTDLGASFGTMGYKLGSGHGKGDLKAYEDSKFISHVHDDLIDFGTPAHATGWEVLGIISIPDFISRMRLRWIGRNIPRGDAKWIGEILAQLSPSQIEDAFRAGGYDDQHIQAYSKILEKRISDLGKL